MTEHTINVPLLQKTLDHITAHPEAHNQSWWKTETLCGTAYCLAGHAAVMTGHVFDKGSSFTVDGGQAVCTVANEELGLTEQQGFLLYSGENKLHELWHLANKMTYGDIEIPEQFRG